MTAVVIEDYSNGNENVPIECVNSYSDERPSALNYQSIRYTTDPKVDLSLASEFLSGCDCQDDCSNVALCACHQLTKSAAVSSAFPHGMAYKFRRLPSGGISSGIFECNDLCKCKKTCLNRVVQNPLTTCLQLFKTLECGWGVRALYDIPAGAFICVYAGNIMSDEKANEIGKTQGDEYFADLDFLLTWTKFKEGYEEEAVEAADDSAPRTPVVATAAGPPVIDLSSDDGETTDDNSTAVVPAKKAKLTSSHRTESTTFRSRATTKPWSMQNYIGEENIYTLDAKLSGNIGRYLNHSCVPNIFVQSVFVDTHVLTLPWVAFFASQFIKAGSELCWDYNYTVGALPGKNIKCRCRSVKCRGRLL